MGSVNLAMEFLGERGGDLSRYSPEHRNAPLNAPIVTTSSGERIVGLHDPRDHDSAKVGIEKEKPWHRMAAHLLNAHKTNAEVAACCEVSPHTVANLRAQRWFNELCVELAHDHAAVLRAKLDSYALEAVEAIHAIATDDSVDSDGKPLTPSRVRLAAHTTLLEHSTGRPTQKVLSLSASTTFSSEKNEHDEIMKELEALVKSQPSNSA